MVPRTASNTDIDNEFGIDIRRRGPFWWIPKWHIVIALVLTMSANILAAVKLYEGATICIETVDRVFHVDLKWMQYAETRLLTADICMLVVVIVMTMIEHLSYLRLKGILYSTVYDEFKPKSCLRHFGGRVACFVGVVISYIAFVFWILFLVGVLVIVFFTSTGSKMCEHKKGVCLDFTAFDYIFPLQVTKHEEYIVICNPESIEVFCKAGKDATNCLIYVIACCFVVILCTTHFCRQLTYNYAILRGKEKFYDYEEMINRKRQFNPQSSMADILEEPT